MSEIKLSKNPPNSEDSDLDPNFFVTPNDARARLEAWGYTPDMWPGILEDERGSHDTRALITIARGEHTVDLNKFYRDHYPEKLAHTEGDAAAEAAANAAHWGVADPAALPKPMSGVAIKGAVLAGAISANHPSIPDEVREQIGDQPHEDVA